MASYEYRCASCEQERDEVFPIGTARQMFACSCGGVMRRVYGNVHIAPSALETKGVGVRSQNEMDRGLDADRPAYARMRKRGLQPDHVGGSARLEDRVGDQADIDHAAILRAGVPKAHLVEVLQGSATGQALSEAAS